MRIYIKDKPLRLKRAESIKDQRGYDLVLDTDDVLINEKKFKGNVLILNATHGIIKSILFILHHKKPKALDSITLATQDYEDAVSLIKSKFRIIQAAGGVVHREDKTLMIYRFDKWDLPKGKIEKGESSAEGAKREVEEECNVKVEISEKLCTTWHTYVQGGKDILKKTSWYLMDCLDDSKMKPQRNEGIEDVKWMNSEQVDIALYSSYRSIQHVYKKFRKYELQSS